MLIKKGIFYYYYDNNNEEIILEINDWKTPFGIEKFGKKEIINLIIPDNNEGLNLNSILNQIKNEIKIELDDYAKIPIKIKNINSLVRCENKIKHLDLDKNDVISGRFRFKIYNFRGNYGISIILEKTD